MFSYLCDDMTRWCPLWCEYKNDRNNVPIYGVRMLFGPKRKPDPNKYILRTDSVHLTDISCYLHGPFNFDSHSDIITAKQHFALTHWEYLLIVCNTLGIVSPILSTLTDSKASIKKRKNKLNPNYTTKRNCTRNNIYVVINSGVM